jgi:ElaB/YqjD/DUF883 family membrane-anchored ribosome-binding protein
MPSPAGPERASRTAEALESVREELRAITERLDELAYDALREAVAAGERSRPELERRVVRARNAIGRALSILERTGAGAEGPAEDLDG